MAKIITFAHQKGGVGKTTISYNLALIFSKDVRVALVDVDPQGSSIFLKGISDTLEVITFDGDFEKLKNSKEFDIFVIDTPPYLSSSLPGLFDVSDYVVIPTKPSPLDLMALKSTVNLVKEALIRNPRLNTSILFNMVKPNRNITKEMKATAEDLYAIPLFDSMIHERDSYIRGMLTSGGVTEQGDLKANAELMALSNELLDKLMA